MMVPNARWQQAFKTRFAALIVLRSEADADRRRYGNNLSGFAQASARGINAKNRDVIGILIGGE